MDHDRRLTNPPMITGGAIPEIKPKNKPTQKPVHIGQLISFPNTWEELEIFSLRSSKNTEDVMITVIPTSPKINSSMLIL
jgi:hypothetical protein